MKQKRRLFLARAAMTLLLTLLIPGGLWAAQTPVSLSDDGAGGWFINMPAKGTATDVANAAVLTLTADDISAGKGTFKVYDDGGKDDYYSHSYSGYLIITAPEGYVPQLSGSVKTESCCDYMRVYNGTTTDKQLGVDYKGSMTVGPLRSNRQSMLIYFCSDGSVYDTGLDLTVELVDARNLDLASILMPAYIPYTGSQIAVNPTVTACDGVVLTKDTHYTVTTVPATVRDPGDYTVTITGIAPYYGTKVANFTVTNIFAGEGTVESPYLISTKSEYLLFASLINASVAPYADNGKVYQLTANIGSELDPITTKVGEIDGAHFKGIFDGDSHTLYVNISDTEHSGTATFGYIEGATIKNLTVAGSVTGGIHAAALVGFSTGTNNLIQNCTVSASVNGGSHIGGILGHGLSSDIAIENCIYSGLMTGGNSAKGAIFGWGDNGGTKSVTNCVYLKHGSQNTSNLDLVQKYGGDVTVTNSYKTANNGSYGIYATAEAPASGISKPITLLGVNLWIPVSVSGIESYYIYNGSVIPVLPTVTCVDNTLTLDTDYTIASTPAPIQATGNYTLTVTGINDYTGTDSKNFEVIQTFANGDGSEATPYLIENADDWNLFAQYMTEGRSTFLNKYYKLTSDITVTTMAGNSSSNCFKGVFDGDNNTMTLNLTATTEGCAPFKYLSGATIKNLNVAGTVTTSSKYGASIAAHTYNTTNIQNCTSSAIITSTFESLADGTHAGFVALNEGSATLNISNCVFTGKLLGANAYANGGFVGWNGGSKVNYIDCLFAPTEITMNELNSATFNRNGKNTFTNTYFLTQFGEAQGIHIATAAPANDVYKSEMVTVRETNYYAVCDITGVNDTYFHTGSAIAVAPVVKLGSTTLTANTDYTVVIKNSSDETVAPEELIANGSYTLIITGMGDYTGSRTMAFRITSGEALNGYTYETGTDAEGTYYMIQSVEDFNQFASFVVSSDNASAGKRFKQTVDLTVTNMVGSTENKSFQGVYDGDNHTLTLGITASSNIAAPFRYVKGATIKNLIIAGTLSNSGKQNGGVAGYSYGDVAISNCTVSASITTSYSGDASNGGFIAHIQTGNVTFNNCAFTGRLLGESANSSAGFVGWRDNTGIVITFNNCLVAPAEITMGVLNSATFNRNGTTNNTYSKCYYLTQYGEAQGIKVVAVAPATDVYTTVTATDANNYYAVAEVAGFKPLYAYTGSAIEVTPVVTLGETLTVGTDYTVTFKNSSDVVVAAENLIELGSYTATIAGAGNYAGSKTFSFRIINGEDLDGYVFETGTDETGKYYVIASEGELQTLAAYVNSGHNASGKRFKQTANITLTKEHTVIGTNSSYSFNGIFDGDNKTISGLVINNPGGENQGLFGYTSGATIKNVVLDNCDITAKKWVGGIVGYANNSTITYCTVSGALKIAAGVAGYDMGGIAGYSSGSLTHCVNTASITGNGTNSKCLGGIAGYNSNGISDNFNAGAVTGATGYVGSIVGQKGGSLTNNYHTVTTVGGVGAENVTTSTDQAGAEVVVKITAGDGVTLTLPAEPTYVWNEENLYKSGTEVTLNYAVPAGKVFDCYTVNSGEISNAGIIDGTHTLTGFTEDVVITGTYANEIINLATAGAVIADIDDLTYNGNEQHPVPVVTLSAETLQEGANYTVSYSDGCINAGNYTVTVTGMGRYTGSVSKNFTINPFNIENCEITMENPVYTGSEIELNPTVKRNGTTMTKDADYTISTVPVEVLEVGDYTMTITGQVNYTGTKAVDFQVLKRWTIGSGNGTSEVLPFHNWYNYALTQQIYTADEMGNQAGNILSIDLRETSTKDCKRTMDIYMVNTDKSSFENSADWIKVTDADKVFSGQVVFPDNDWATITLDTPFMYDGTSNLAIIFDVTYVYGNGDTYGNGPVFLVYNGSSNQTLYQYSDGTNLDPQSDITTTGSLASNKNQVRLVINRHDRIEMNAHGVMTYASDNVLDFTNVSGLTATYASNFASTGSHSGTLTMTQAEQVPAGEGLFLKGTANETYYVPVIDAAAALAPANMLVGLTTPTLVPQVNGNYTNFIFAKHGDDFGWYRLAGDYTLKAHSAYLPLLTNSVYTGGGAIAITMDFGDGEATDINKVEADDDANADGDWYTLDGLKLEKKPTKKGVYIKDGRKVVVK